MYSRSYPRPQNGRIPPNYNGNAFDLARTGAPDAAKTESSVRHEAICETFPEKRRCEKEVRPNPLATLFFRRGGRRIEGDDILLAGLIILLLTSGADEELILILGFLFFVGL
ncbi:MAG: hypothetical protein IJC50_07160 [Clostridia bacterium]|nr:hypothetical protein [Clostridia bacterium]